MPATVVLIIDGLSANLPGPYGNTTVETPALNRLAAEAMLFDFCFVESPLLPTSYAALWQDLIGEGCLLVSDCPEVLTLGSNQSFDSIIDASGPTKAELAEVIAETHSANFFAQAIEALQTLDSEGICWLHHAGFNGQWDAPWELRCSFADEEDPEPPRSVDRPVAQLNLAEVDPDVLLGYQQSAYAQLTVIDQLLGLFLDQLRESGIFERSNFVLASTRGYPLGEHGGVGLYDNVYNETMQVPLMIREANANGPVFGSRQGGLVQLADLNQLLAGLRDANADGSRLAPPSREAAFLASDSYAAIQTPTWKLIRSTTEPACESAEPELYAKPDDRWDMNDVSRRCASVVEELSGIHQDGSE